MASASELAQKYYDDGVSSLFSNDFESALTNLKLAREIFEELENHNMYIKTLNAMGITYGNMGFIAPMTAIITEGISYCDKYNVIGGKSLFYSCICDKYMYLGEYDNAINYGLMALQDLQDGGDSFERKDTWLVVANLNLCYCYLQTLQYSNAKLYLTKASESAREHNLSQYNFTISVLTVRLNQATGVKDYLDGHLDDILDFVKSNDTTLIDYVLDLKILTDIFLKAGDFEHALIVTRALGFGSTSSEIPKFKLEAAKLAMRIYKAIGDRENYVKACVEYAETDMQIKNDDMNNQLMELDTNIALSIIATI